MAFSLVLFWRGCVQKSARVMENLSWVILLDKGLKLNNNETWFDCFKVFEAFLRKPISGFLRLFSY